MGDREAVGLVAQALQEVEPFGGAREDQRVLLPRNPDLLQALGQPAEHDLALEPELLQHRRGGVDLRQPTVDDDQRRRIREAGGLAGGGVDLDLGGAVVDQTTQATGEHLRHGRDVVGALEALDDEAPVLTLAREPVLEHHHRADGFGAHGVRDVVALDAQWRLLHPQGFGDLVEGLRAGGEVGGAAQLGLLERHLGVLDDGVEQRTLLAAQGDADVDLGAPPVRQVRDERVLGLDRRQDVRRNLQVVGVELLEERLQELGERAVVGAVGDPAALAADAAVDDVEDLHGHLVPVVGQAHDVDAEAVGEHDGVLFLDLLERGQGVAQDGGALEVEIRGGLVHVALDAPDDAAGLASHEGAEVLGDLAVLLGAHPADARCGALADVAQQAGAPGGPGAVEHALGAGAHGEHAQQEVHGLADGPRLAEGAEVAHTALLRAAADEDPGVLLVHRDGEPGVGLVVAVLHVEPRVELLDPRVLELERLEFVAHHRPFDLVRGAHHRLGAEVQCRGVREVGVQALTQVFCLAHVEDVTERIEEPVHPGVRGDAARAWAVARGIGHAGQPTQPAHDLS